jgi:hypothetical protein
MCTYRLMANPAAATAIKRIGKDFHPEGNRKSRNLQQLWRSRWTLFEQRAQVLFVQSRMRWFRRAVMNRDGPVFQTAHKLLRLFQIIEVALVPASMYLPLDFAGIHKVSRPDTRLNWPFMDCRIHYFALHCRPALSSEFSPPRYQWHGNNSNEHDEPK